MFVAILAVQFYSAVSLILRLLSGAHTNIFFVNMNFRICLSMFLVIWAFSVIVTVQATGDEMVTDTGEITKINNSFFQ